MESAEKELSRTSKQVEKSKELATKSSKSVDQAGVLKREAVKKYHAEQEKMGVREDPKTVIDAVDGTATDVVSANQTSSANPTMVSTLLDE